MKKLVKMFVIMLFVTTFFVPQLSFAESSKLDLDDAFEQFRSDYEKEEKYELRLAQENQSEINDRRIIVKMDEGATFDESHFGINLVEKIDTQIYVVQVFAGDDYWTKLQELENSADVLYAEPDYLLENSFVPADPLFNKQWHLKRIGMNRAWDITRGSSGVTIAVLDSGVNANHPDLKGRVLQGYDFINNNSDASDDNGHGTHIAGVIAANANTFGVVGVDHAAKVLPVKVFCGKGTGSLSNAIKGIHYAINQGVDVINMSYVTSEKSKAEEEALWKAYHNGIVLVASAGNDGHSHSMYPASYPHVISVAATDMNNKRAGFSNYGYWIDLSAPGTDIYSTSFVGGYGIQSGTSFSAPIVSALAGLVKGQHPEWSPSEIEWALGFGAEKLSGTEWNYIFGFGRVDAYKTLTAKLPSLGDDAGNVSSEAKVLPEGVALREKIDLPLDVDWFTFNVSKRSELAVEFSNLPKHIDLVGVLYKYDGSKVETLSVIDHGGMGENEKLVEKVGPGTYYLSVHDYYGRWSQNPYQVKVSMNANLSFPDVREYKKEIEFLTQKEVIRGFPDGTFKPKRNVTRIQAVHMILREMGIDVEKLSAANPGFSDMKPGDYGYEAVAAAVELGFIKGKPNNTFDPNGYLTRGQMASILVKAYGLEGSYNGEFKDVPSNHWANGYVSRLAANGITTGYEDGTFKPDRRISREHFSVFMYRMLEGD